MELPDLNRAAELIAFCQGSASADRKPSSHLAHQDAAWLEQAYEHTHSGKRAFIITLDEGRIDDATVRWAGFNLSRPEIIQTLGRLLEALGHNPR